MRSVVINTLEQTQALACALAAVVSTGDVIGLTGDLGAGKTTFTRYLVQALVGKDVEVLSPTFTLVQTFDTPKGAVWHFDLYRLKTQEEIYEIGLEEALDEGISIIEWPQIITPLLPSDRLMIELAVDASGVRSAMLEGHGVWAEKLTQIILK